MNTSALSEAILTSTVPAFAVVDGAQFDDLPSLLNASGLTYRPLYADHTGNGGVEYVVAPQMVWLDRAAGIPPLADQGTPRPQVLDRLMSIVGDLPAAVFWVCPNGGDALFRHLRTINMIRVPKDAGDDDEEGTTPSDEYWATGDAANSQPATDDDGLQMVLFRHADANAMAQVLPSLNGNQAVRLFGPATRILFSADEQWTQGSGIIAADRPPNDFQTPVGPLTLDNSVLDHVDDQQISASRGRIVEYLKETAPEYAEKLSEVELRELVVQSEKSGNEIGLLSEYAHGLWAFLTLVTGGSLLGSPELRNHFASSGKMPDQALEEIVEELGAADDASWESWAS